MWSETERRKVLSVESMTGVSRISPFKMRSLEFFRAFTSSHLERMRVYAPSSSISVNARGNVISGVNIAYTLSLLLAWRQVREPTYVYTYTPVERLGNHYPSFYQAWTIYGRVLSVRAWAQSNVCASFIGADAYIRYVAGRFYYRDCESSCLSFLRPSVRPYMLSWPSR